VKRDANEADTQSDSVVSDNNSLFIR